MAKIAVVYWSGTGNTEKMAETIAEELRGQGNEVELLTCDSFSADKIRDFDGFAFGCSAMGDEVLEEDEFEPMFTSVEDKLGDKPTIIFGSYEWNDGQWMRDWTKRCQDKGIKLLADGLAGYDYPDDDCLAECRKLAGLLKEAL